MIDDVCSLLDDGGWHGVDEIAREAGLTPISVGFVLSFLRKYEFVEMSAKCQGKARMKKSALTLKQVAYILKALLEKQRQTPGILVKTLETRSVLL